MQFLAVGRFIVRVSTLPVLPTSIVSKLALDMYVTLIALPVADGRLSREKREASDFRAG